MVVKAFLSTLERRLLTVSKSAKANSKFTISISLIGSIVFSTWTILLFSKHLTTWTIASTSLILPKNWFPNPSPFDAPFTNPAISVNSKVVFMVFLGLNKVDSLSTLSSGTSTILIFGLIVANG